LINKKREWERIKIQAFLLLVERACSLSLSSDEIDDGMSMNICTTKQTKHTMKKKEEQHILEKIKSI